MPQEGQTGEEPQTTGQAPADTGQEPATFTSEYVQELRQEAAKYRTQLREVQEQVGQFADYDELKRAAEELQKRKDADKSELEKFQEAAAKAERERDEARQRAQDTLIRAAFIEEASKAGVANPGDAYRLADLSSVSIDEETGQVEGAEEAVAALVDAGRLPMTGKQPAPSLNGGAGSGARPGTPTLSDEEMATAKKMGLSSEDYLKHKKMKEI
jgi:phage I-like protein